MILKTLMKNMMVLDILLVMKKKKIPLVGEILAIVDSYSAMARLQKSLSQATTF